MVLTRLPIIVSVAAALACGLFVDIYSWEGARTWVIPALSIVAAAVLVRLARGVPVTNSDHLSKDDVDDVAAAFTTLSRSLRTLFFVVLGAIVAVGVASPIAAILADHLAVPFDYGNRTGSGIVGLFVGYSFARVMQVAQSDVSIADLQARLLKQGAAGKQAKTFEGAAMQPSTFRQPEGYGKPLQ